MAWTTALDFTPPVNPGFGGASSMTPSLRRSHRPSQLSIDGAASLVSPAVSRPDSLPSLEAATARSTETTVPDFGITMTFSAPDPSVNGPIYPGVEFSWSVFVVNRTGAGAVIISTPAGAAAAGPIPFGPPAPTPPMPHTGATRKLALRVIPKRRRNEVRVVRPPSARSHLHHNHSHSHHSTAPSAAAGEATAAGKSALAEHPPGLAFPDPIADAVLDENIVHAMQRSSLVDGAEVICLSADVRVGPLAPGACHLVELRFLALGKGGVASGIEAVRVIDLVTQEHVDIRELPVIVVEAREDDGVGRVMSL